MPIQIPSLTESSQWKIDAMAELRAEISESLLRLGLPELRALSAFTDQIVMCYDPDVVNDFLQWRDDPTLGSILQLAAALSEDAREQLLFHAEDLFSGEQSPDPEREAAM